MMYDMSTEQDLDAGVEDALVAAMEDFVSDLMVLTDEQKRIYELLVEAGQSRANAYTMVLDHVDPVRWEETPFAVTDLSSADWVLKKMAEAQAQIDEIDEHGFAEIKAIEARLEEMKRPALRAREFFSTVYSGQLQEFTRTSTQGRKEKSVKLIYGAIGFRTTPGRFIVDDEPASIEWCRIQAPHAIRESVRPSEFRKALEAEYPDPAELAEVAFAHIEGGGESFYIKAALPTAQAESDE